MGHVGSGAVSGDLEGSPLAPRIKGNATRLQIADSIFMPRFRGDYMAPLPIGSSTTFERRGYWTGGSVAMVLPTNDIVTPPMPFKGRLRRATLLGLGGPGGASVDVRKVTLATLPPTNANSICGGAPIITTSANFTDMDEAAMIAAGWNVVFAKGDIYSFTLNTVNTFTDLLIVLRLG